MKINPTYFCSLSSSTSFLSWLKNHNGELYQQLIVELRESKGCTQNATIMLRILNKLNDAAESRILLYDFLREKYPHIIINDNSNIEVPVFGYYDPTLLTIPRRVILSSEDEAISFLSSKADGDYVVVENKVYVEFIPLDLIYLISAVPNKNWLVRVWKSNQRQN